MSTLGVTSAFVKACPALGHTSVTSVYVKANQALRHITTSTTTTTSSIGIHPATQLYGATKMLDYATKTLSISFFDGFKTPAILLAGTSFAALFATMETSNVKDTSFISKREVLFLRLYHVCSLLTFCLSLTTLLTSQVATTCLMGSNLEAPKNMIDAYDFLRRGSLNAEFLLIRWSFVASILFFVKSTTCRMIVDFDLFSKRRLSAGLLVVSMMGAVVTGLLSYINCSHYIVGNYWDMTKELGSLIWNRIYTQRYPLQITCLSLSSIALLSLFKFLWPGTIEQDQLADNDRYI